VRRPGEALLCAVLVGAAAAGTGSLALLALGTGVLLLTCAAWAALAVSARRVCVERRLSAAEVQEDASVHAHFTVCGPAWLPIRIEVEDHVGGWTAIEHRRTSLELAVRRPGAYLLAPTRVRLRDPFRVFERQSLAGRSERLLILPVPQRGSIAVPGHSGRADDPEPHGLKPYRPGTPVKHIHWPTLARGGELQARNFAPPQDRLPLVVVDTAGAERLEALDWAARTAAGHILTLARKGGCRVLLPGERKPTSVMGTGGEWRSVHRRLAALGDPAPRNARANNVGTTTICVRAAMAPRTLPPAPALPHGVLAAARCRTACV
jgi:uncharacterized protein (DUF58 family)